MPEYCDPLDSGSGFRRLTINLDSSRAHHFQGPVNGYIGNAESHGQLTAYSTRKTSTAVLALNPCLNDHLPFP
jgi:hypothetical protein